MHGLQRNRKDNTKVAKSQRPNDKLPSTQVDRTLLILFQKIVERRNLLSIRNAFINNAKLRDVQLQQDHIQEA